MYPGKMQRIRAEYKRLYPAGKVETIALKTRNVRLMRVLAISYSAIGKGPVGSCSN